MEKYVFSQPLNPLFKVISTSLGFIGLLVLIGVIFSPATTDSSISMIGILTMITFLLFYPLYWISGIATSYKIIINNDQLILKGGELIFSSINNNKKLSTINKIIGIYTKDRLINLKDISAIKENGMKYKKPIETNYFEIELTNGSSIFIPYNVDNEDKDAYHLLKEKFNNKNSNKSNNNHRNNSNYHIKYLPLFLLRGYGLDVPDEHIRWFIKCLSLNYILSPIILIFSSSLVVILLSFFSIPYNPKLIIGLALDIIVLFIIIPMLSYRIKLIPINFDKVQLRKDYYFPE